MLIAALACAALAAALDERRANLAAHGRFFSAHRLQGTLLSHPVLAFAQFWHAMGVLPATVGTPPGSGSIGSLASWYVEWCLWRRSLGKYVCERRIDWYFSDESLTFEQKIVGKHCTGVASHWCLCNVDQLVKVGKTVQKNLKSSRLGMCLSRCSLRVKLFPQYAQNTMVAQSPQTVRQWQERGMKQRNG